MPEQYTYAVARIHTKESAMLNFQDMERLLAANEMTEAMAILAEKGYDSVGAEGADEVVERERASLWKLISELVSDMSVFDIFLLEKDFHNLKAAVKSVVSTEKAPKIFVEGGTVSWALIEKAVKNREFSDLPEFLKDTAEKAVKALLETGDGGICDVICDKAYLEACLSAGERSDSPMIRRYAELTVALSDIRIAARGARLGKAVEFFRRALAECKTLDCDSLGVAASKGIDELGEYLKMTDYSAVSELLKENYTVFEKWCDDRLMTEIKKEKNNYFTIAPIAAYILAKENELKMVGLVLTAKQNKLDEEVVRERLRELYV